MSEIICGDALDTLKTLPDGIVQTCVTSPPYFSLRDYNCEGQIGLESTPDEYIARLVEVFREVRRVLRDDGTLWVNIGDSYATGASGDNLKNASVQAMAGSYNMPGTEGRKDTGARKRSPVPGYKPKDLIGIPWMLAFALRADGWYLRSDIIWHKPNCMPESVEDRPTKAHEYIFLLSKSERYYYDHTAILEPQVDDEKTFYAKLIKKDHKQVREYGTDSWARTKVGFKSATFNPAGRNKRSVWTVSTSPFSEAHFATFPPKLIEPCILAGTSPRACEHCGAPWERVTERVGYPDPVDNTDDQGRYKASGEVATDTGRRKVLSGSKHAEFKRLYPDKHLGWQPTCTCDNTGSGSCVVLDPFCGAGTVPLVALKYQRQYIGIELNPEYVKLINKRIHTTQPVLWEVPA